MVISILQFDPRGQFQGQKVITPKFTQIIKMMSDLNSWVSPLFKDNLFFQIEQLFKKIWLFEISHHPFFMKFSKRSWNAINEKFQICGLKVNTYVYAKFHLILKG